MKKVLICGIVIGICFSNTQAQDEFAPIGAKWTYTSSVIVPPDTRGPYTIEVVGKEQFQGKLCSRIHIPHHWAGRPWVGDPLYVYESSDSVFYWSPYSEAFHLLYDFSAVIGDTITVDGLLDWPVPECDEGFRMVIDSISHFMAGTDSLKVWHIEHLPQDDIFCFDWYPYEIVENIGSLDFILPCYGFFNEQIGGLRCYSDSIHDYQFVPYSCDTVFTGTLGSKDIDDINEFISISPNPVSESLHVISSTDCFDCIISIYSVQGQLMLQQKQSIPGEVDVSRLPEGMYVCRVQRDGIRSRGELFVISR